jgi:putative hemolysin
MKKNWKLFLVLLIILLAASFLLVQNNQESEPKSLDNNINNVSQVEYQSTNLNLAFKYDTTEVMVNENGQSINLYSKEAKELLLTINGDNCDFSTYNDLERISVNSYSFRKFANDSGYFTIHPYNNFCLIIAVPGVAPEGIPTQAGKDFLDNFIKDVVFKDSGLIIAKYDFACNDGLSLTTSFVNNETSSVDLYLSDGRAFSLMQGVSASGARYVNKDESIAFWNKGDSASLEENGKITFADCSAAPKKVSTELDSKNNKIANPASTNCLTQGGSLEIQTKEDGSQYGLCYFEDARACEEWAMLRGECPVGGVKTTGYDNLSQKYCAWLGGKTTAEDNSVCTFSDNSTCLNSDLYLDACQKGDWPK